MARPKFKQNEKVEIVKGFYRGNTGTITNYDDYRVFLFKYFNYRVVFDKESSYHIIDECDLRSLDDLNEKFNKKLEKLIK